MRGGEVQLQRGMTVLNVVELALLARCSVTETIENAVAVFLLGDLIAFRLLRVGPRKFDRLNI